MKESARQARAESRIVGFVPTMGALHAGHTALVQRAKQQCAPVVASIFVNPKQFGPNEDFAKYPRTLEADSEKFSAAGVDALFLPDAAEIYPSGFRTYVTVEGLSHRLEGRSRPGHFRGVATVVMKLLEIVAADAFEPVTRIARPCYALLAVFIGKTRLIDNLYLEPVGDSGELAYHL